MKIKSITLTNNYEIYKNEGYAFAGEDKNSPICQVEYEETTPTGLTAKGTTEIKGDNLEKVVKLFNFLEGGLTKEYIKKEIKGGKVDCKGKKSPLHNTEPDMPFDDRDDSSVEEIVDILWDAKQTSDLIKSISKAFEKLSK